MANNYLYLDDNGKEQEGVITAGTGITVAFDGTARTETITNAGVTHVNTIAGDVTLAAGSGVTITPSGSTLTFSATASGSYVNLQTGTLTAQNGSADITGQGTNPGLMVSSQSGYAQIHVVPGSSSLSISPSNGDLMALSDGTFYGYVQSHWAQMSLPQLTSFPVGYAAGYQVQRSDLSYAVFTYDGSAWNQATIPAGTAFPGSPITGLRFWRSDRNLEYFYNGTNWLTTTLYSLVIGYYANGLTVPYATASAGTLKQLVAFPSGAYSIYLENLLVAHTSNATFNSTNYWNMIFARGDTGATVATIPAWQVGRVAGTNYSDSAAINTVFATSVPVFYLYNSLTGSPGTFTMYPSVMNYRLVG